MKELKGPISFSQPPAIIEHMDVDTLAIQAAWDLQAIKDQAKRKAEKLAAMKAWSDPEAVAARYKKHEEDAAEALARGRRMAAEFGEWVYPEPLPDPLPKECQGQCESTIRAMLGHKKKFKEPTGFGVEKKASTFSVESKSK